MLHDILTHPMHFVTCFVEWRMHRKAERHEYGQGALRPRQQSVRKPRSRLNGISAYRLAGRARNRNGDPQTAGTQPDGSLSRCDERAARWNWEVVASAAACKEVGKYLLDCMNSTE
jgi:hypothetical protein